MTVYTASSGGTLATVGGVFAGAGTLALVVALLLRFPAALPWAVFLVGGGYVVGREHHALVDGWAPVVGGALLLAAELATWSIEDDRRIREERELVVRRALTVAALVAASVLVSFVLVGAAAVSSSAGLVLTGMGVAAAVAAVAVVLRLVRG